MDSSRLPVLFEDRTTIFRALLVLVVPSVFGAIAGLVLGPSPGWYLVIQAVGAVGGLFAGLEHQRPGLAALRGGIGGLFFGMGIVLAHALAGGPEHGLVPQPALLPAITAVAGAILAALGALLRRRLEPGT